MSNGANDKLPMTIRGKAMLDAELKKLLLEERPSVILAIEEARAQGDISENAEYEAAKERQAMIEGRIAEIQGKIAGADVIDVSAIKSDRVVFGAHVTAVDTETEEEIAYQIVGVDEADVKKGMISVLSPLARAMIGKKVGDTVTVQSPKGDKEFEILSLQYK
ncbi:MAG TPA: transcription elongation factor GreA [Bdellovibrio sp.]|uniref:transcription elongation factor GreA n=1 Tax=Bdellovibrio sp. TaxID=28201 RepID=UPI002EFA9C07